MQFQIRQYRPDNFDALLILWRISRERSLPDFQLRKGHFLYEDLAYLRDHVLRENQVWVAQTEQGQLVGFLALCGDFIDQLYIHPDFWRQGIGSLLLGHARQLSPLRLTLFTLQVNLPAQAFYESRGFRPVAYGISPAPENEPDIRYLWEAG